MTANNLLKVLKILVPLCEKNEPFCAEHDVVYLCGPSPKVMHGEDLQTLEDLGAIYDEELGSWKCYT